MKPNPLIQAALAALALGALHPTAQAQLIHRYSFNEFSGTTVSDSEGGADGVIKGLEGTYYFDGAGRLTLLGGGASADAAESIAGYVDLPNHLINVLDKVTLETWVAWDTSGSAWQRIFDLGTSAGGEDIVDGNGAYIFGTPQGGPGALRVAVRDPDTGTEFTQLDAGGPLATSEEVCVTFTYDPSQDVARLYSNAVLVATGPAPIALADINDVNNWLGRSQWNDPMFTGSYNEFRIYDTALNPVEAAASFVSGTENPSTDPANLGGAWAVHLGASKTTMRESDTQTAVPTADFGLMSGISLVGVPEATLTSDDESVATISPDGVISALAPGVANLTLSYGGLTEVVPLTVTARDAGIAVAGALAVDLRAADTAANAGVWPNRAVAGGSGDFYATGTAAYVANVQGTGIAGVEFVPANSDSYLGPITTADLTGNSDCSIEVWAYNPAIAAEETLVAWGRRGGPDGSNMSFNYGSNGAYGAVGHWGAPDMGWSGTPAAGQWHYLVYAYDGVNTAKVYADGVLKYSETFGAPLNTHPDFPIRVGVQTDAAGVDPDFGQAFSGYIATVRVHTEKLTDADVANNFLYGPTLEAPGELQTVELQLSRDTIYGARDIGQASVLADYENLKGIEVTGFSTLESSDTEVLTVNAAGRFTAVSPGTATLTATYQGRTGTAVVTVEPAPGLALKHRYSFGETGGTTVEDSVGTADGEIKGEGALFDGGGHLSLPGGVTSAAEPPAGYVDLPNHIISPLVNVSFETWVTWDTSGSAWQRIFDFGTSAGGEDVVNGNGSYLFLSPQGDTNLRFAVRDPVTGAEPTQLTADGPLTMGEEVHLVAVYNFTGNESHLYSNGVQIRSGTATVPLISINDVNNWLARSQWNDNMFQGTFNEFRIWQGALSADDVAANYAAGPDVVPEPPVENPDLTIALDGSNVVITWPANATGFVLKVSSSLPASNWVAIDTSGAVEEGDRMKLTLPITSLNQFYVLVK